MLPAMCPQLFVRLSPTCGWLSHHQFETRLVGGGDQNQLRKHGGIDGRRLEESGRLQHVHGH